MKRIDDTRSYRDGNSVVVFVDRAIRKFELAVRQTIAQSIFDRVIAVIAIKGRKEEDGARSIQSPTCSLRLYLSSSLSPCHLVLSSCLSHSASPGE